ncbi:MAG: hypothetical protein QXP98_07885 [Thermoproteus sp.]
MCITKDLLVRFYGSLDFSLRTLIHYRVLTMFGKPFDYFILEEPWSVYDILTKALGRHNADLFVHMLKSWLDKNGCRLSIEEVKVFLSNKKTWST